MSSTITNASNQVVNVGPIGKYLFGNKNAESSLFQVRETLITEYARNTATVLFDEAVGFDKSLTASIPRLGDLLGEMYIEISLPALRGTGVSWTNAVGFAMVEEVEFVIGGTVFSRIGREFMEILDYLGGRGLGVGSVAGRYDSVNLFQRNGNDEAATLLIKLPFWFCLALGQCLPIYRMQFQDIQVRIKTASFSHCIVNNEPVSTAIPVPKIDIRLIVDFYILNVPEKMEAIAADYTQTFEQFQSITYLVPDSTHSGRYTLPFTSAIKVLYIVFREIDSETNNDWFNNKPRGLRNDFIKSISLSFNGKPRFEEYKEVFLRRRNSCRNIYTISFSANPDTNQSTGSANFNMLENVQLEVNYVPSVPNCRIFVFAKSYNTYNYHAKQSMMGLGFF